MPGVHDAVPGGIDPVPGSSDQMSGAGNRLSSCTGADPMPCGDELRTNALRLRGDRCAVSCVGCALPHGRGGQAVNRFA